MSNEIERVRLGCGEFHPGNCWQSIIRGKRELCKVQGKEKRETLTRAALIVRAVNSHDALVEVAAHSSRGECTCVDGGDGFTCDVCRAKAALALAKRTSPGYAGE